MEFKTEMLENLIEKNKERIPVSEITARNYISTENMIVDKGGILEAATLPSSKTVKSYKEGDILLSNIRPYFKKIWLADRDGGVSNDVLVIRANTDIVDNSFLYFYLSQDKFFEYMVQTSKGTKMPRGDKDAIRKYNIYLPNEIKHQQNIAHVGASIDKKIINNNKMIANLEELSQTLFKRWFVDFEFPDENGNPYKSSGGEFKKLDDKFIPENWKEKTINDYANEYIITGKTPPTKNKENYSDSGVPFITIPDMHHKTFITDTERFLSAEGKRIIEKKLLPKNSIIVSCIATPGLVSITSEESVTNQQINSFTPEFSFLYFLYFSLTNLSNYIKDLGSGGSATLNLNKTQFSKIKIYSPDEATVESFNILVENYFKKIHILSKQNEFLNELRDTLLPKLMSGELELPEALEV